MPRPDPFGEELWKSARLGDLVAREELLRAYTPFVLKVASQVAGRFLYVGRDEEVSIGLLALSEAIDRYDERRGVSFWAFAELVIRRRLIDYYRRERRAEERPLSEFEREDEEGAVDNPLADAAGVRAFLEKEEALARREEIEAFAMELAAFGIGLEELARVSPKHRDARQGAQAVARLLAEDPALMAEVRRTGRLPLNRLGQLARVHRKTLERHRKYILAMALVHTGPYPYLQEYLKGGSER